MGMTDAPSRISLSTLFASCDIWGHGSVAQSTLPAPSVTHLRGVSLALSDQLRIGFESE
jgi:hypothetical protein